MKVSRILVYFMMLSLLLTVPPAYADTAGKENWPDQLKLTLAAPGGSWFALGSTMADLWSKEVVLVSSSTGGSISNIINCERNRGDMGFTNISMLSAGINGDPVFRGEQIKNVSLIANLYSQYFYVVMNKKFAERNGVNTFKDVIDKKLPVRVSTLKPGTATEVILKVLLEKGYGVTYDDLKSWGGTVEFSSYEGGADLLADGHLDIFAFFTGRMASVVMNIESTTDIVLLEIDQFAIDAVAETYGTETFTIEPGTYKSVTKPVKTIGEYVCIVGRNDIPDDLVYELCKSLWANKESLAHAVSDISELTTETALIGTVPTHPGAKKFWDELSGSDA